MGFFASGVGGKGFTWQSVCRITDKVIGPFSGVDCWASCSLQVAVIVDELSLEFFQIALKAGLSIFGFGDQLLKIELVLVGRHSIV